MTTVHRYRGVTYDAKRVRFDGKTVENHYDISSDYAAITTPNEQTSGTWVTIGSGRFRLPTAYGRSSVSLTPTAAENSQGFTSSGTYWDYWMKSSLGGDTSQAIGNNMAFRFADYGITSLRSPPGFVTQEENEAITKSLNKIADNKANIAENLATFGQVVRLFTSPTRNMIQGLQRFHKQKEFSNFFRKSFRDLLRGNVDRDVAERYLTYVYGFKPLMQDIYGVAELAKEAGNLPLLVSGHQVASRQYETPEYSFMDASANRMNTFRHPSIKSKTRASLWARLDDDYRGTRAVNQLGLANPLSLVWELVPYSFLVDWLLPIGPVLQALTAPAGLDFVGGSLSRRVSLTCEHEVYTQLENRYGTPATSDLRYEGYSRKKLSSWPRPGLWIDRDPLRLQADGSDRIFKGLALSLLALPRS